MVDPQIGRQLGLEREALVTGGDPPGTKHPGDRLDVCIVDTNPNPDIRVVSALVSADFVLSPIQLNQEALDGVAGLLNHPRVGLRRIKAMLNAKLALIGLLPTMVEATPFQRDNFVQLIEQYSSLMIPLGDAPGNFAKLPRRTARHG